MNKNINTILNKEFEIKMISKINNNPNVNLEENSLKELCLLLHYDIDLNSIKNYLKFSDYDLNKNLNTLIKENLIIEKENYYKPNLMVISIEDYNIISAKLNDITNETLTLIENNLNKIKEITFAFNCFKNFNFNDLSLFILSDVILDFIQIDNVENMFLKKDRTLHGNKNYYYSFHEKGKNSKREALDIYGNQLNSYDNILFGVYGNSRNLANFNNIDLNYIIKYMPHLKNRSETTNQLKTYLLNQLINYSKSNSLNLNPDILYFFNKLGLVNDNLIGIPILNESEFSQLTKIADIIKYDFIEILKFYKTSLYEDYLSSIYYNEISFEEYFIWWYHIFYSKVTDLLIEKNIIILPSNYNFNYVIVKD